MTDKQSKDIQIINNNYWYWHNIKKLENDIILYLFICNNHYLSFLIFLHTFYTLYFKYNLLNVNFKFLFNNRII